MMEPNNHERMGSVRQAPSRPAPQRTSGTTSQVSSAVSGVRRLTSDESWIEVSSQPSSSSLSSATTDEIITTGLRITQSMNARRRRRLHRSLSGNLQESSQDDGDSEDGESDQVMSSSNEDTRAGFRRSEEIGRNGRYMMMPSSTSTTAQLLASDEGEEEEEDDDDDENATALGVPDTNQVFTPQPNAFTYPPSTRTNSTIEQESYFSNHRSSSYTTQNTTSTPPTSQSAQRPAYTRSHTRTRSHTPYNMISPNHTVPIDHDAALRASLSTLLSCAAAARGLQKRDSTQSTSQMSQPPTRASAPNRIDQGTLRLIPESSLEESSVTAPPLPRRPSQRSSSSDSPGLHKRKSKSPSHEKRKKRQSGLQTTDENDARLLSPTLMTWMMGAGVVVLFSAISFSAGYALGKEVGGMEANGASCLSCGSEADSGIGLGRSLRGRGWRWGNASTGVRV